MAFGLYYFSKMDEVHIISYMYIDKAGIPMLVTMHQKIKWGKAQIMGVNQYIYTTGSTSWCPQWEVEYIN